MKDIAQRWNLSLIDWLRYVNREILPLNWMGVKVYKSPLDLWMIQEIIYEVRPDILVEIGSAFGGAALYYAHIFDILNKGRVITIDINREVFHVNHSRVTFLHGDSVSPKIIEEVYGFCEGKTVMVDQDGRHCKEKVLQDLNSYCDLVTLGSYLIVEDGFIDVFDHQWSPSSGEEGPLAAINEFLSGHPEFEINKYQERLIATFHPCGYLEKKAEVGGKRSVFSKQNAKKEVRMTPAGASRSN